MGVDPHFMGVYPHNFGATRLGRLGSSPSPCAPCVWHAPPAATRRKPRGRTLTRSCSTRPRSPCVHRCPRARDCDIRRSVPAARHRSYTPPRSLRRAATLPAGLRHTVRHFRGAVLAARPHVRHDVVLAQDALCRSLAPPQALPPLPTLPAATPPGTAPRRAPLVRAPRT